MPKQTKKSSKKSKKSSAKDRSLLGKLFANKSAPIFLAIFAVLGGYFVYNSLAVTPTSIGFENADTSKCTGGVNTASATFVPTTAKAYDGTYSAYASYPGGTSNAYARCVVTTSWQTGDDIWYGEAVFLPTGFTGSIQGQVDLMRWDNYSLNNASQDWGGIVIFGSDHLARLRRFSVSDAGIDLSPKFTVPEGRWVWLEVRQRLNPTDGQALSETYMDGDLLGSSTLANTYGREITRIRYGLVAIAAGQQTNPLGLYVDRATISTTKVGSLGAPTTPAPTPSPTPTPTPSPAPTPPASTGTTTLSVEGETFAYSTSFGGITTDSKDSGGKDLRYGKNGVASKVLSINAATKLSLRVRAWTCSVKPILTVGVDGSQVFSGAISATNYSSYSIPVNVGAGNHRFTVGMTGGKYTSSNCGNSIHFDKMTVQ